MILRCRNRLYDAGCLKVYTVSVPTICVGNLALGGTGKTPHVEYLIRLLKDHYRIAVLSLGYKRQTKGFVWADEQATAATIGDEPMQIHCRFADVPVAVCQDRVQGIAELQKRVSGLQVVLLDDAFQYRRLKPTCNILLTAADRLYTEDHVLPWGHLRDHPLQAGGDALLR